MEFALVSLFFGSLLASTILPFGVEALLYYLLHEREYTFLTLLAVATAGNTLGGVVSYAMGGLLERGVMATGWGKHIAAKFSDARGGADGAALARIRRYGIPVLFFSWMPVIGDPLCIAAGYLRLRFWPSVCMIFSGKLVRYLVLLWVYTRPWATPPA